MRVARSRASGPPRTATPSIAPRSGAGRRSRWIPKEIHGIGLDELAAIDDERRAIARAAGFGDDVVAYRASLDEAPGNTPRSKDELVERAREDIDRAMAEAPRYFGLLPKAGLQVRPVEEYKEKDAPFAYYYPPSATGDRDGIYYANGYDLPSRKYTKLASTTYHEAAPGHHFQIALEMENPRPDHVPAPRRADGRRGVRRGLGPVQRAARR